jgi:MtN3 and saliva related transmembrane protein
MMDYINILGYVATAIGLSMMLPQIAKMYKTKKVEDVSLLTICFYLLQSVLWTYYGYLISASPVLVGNAIATLIATWELYLKLKYENK